MPRSVSFLRARGRRLDDDDGWRRSCSDVDEAGTVDEPDEGRFSRRSKICVARREDEHQQRVLALFKAGEEKLTFSLYSST